MENNSLNRLTILNHKIYNVITYKHNLVKKSARKIYRVLYEPKVVYNFNFILILLRLFYYYCYLNLCFKVRVLTCGIHALYFQVAA